MFPFRTHTLRLAFFVAACLPVLGAWAQSADITQGCAPLTVQFTPPAGATTWFWDFKDGGTSNFSNPSNIFTDPGAYAVEFRNSPGGPVLGTVQITVWAKPDVMVSATPNSGCIPLNVQFQDNSTLDPGIQVLSRSWVFGDGGSAVNNPSPLHTYNGVGTFTVSLELLTNYPSCNITEVFPNLVSTVAKPAALFSTNPAPPQACEPPLTVSFANLSSGAGVLAYAWDFGNGNNSTLQNPPQQTYTAAGTYTVSLTVTNAQGCTATTQTNVVIGGPTAGFFVPDTVCYKSPVNFTNTSTAGTYVWNFGPGATPPGSLAVSPINVLFNIAGNQTIRLIVNTAGGCSDTLEKTIYVQQADAAFTVSPTYACGDPVVFNLNALSPFATQWTWDLPYDNISSLKSPTYTWTSPDTTGYSLQGPFRDSIELVVETVWGCRDTFRQAIEVWRPHARYVPNQVQGCGPLVVAFADSSYSNEPIVEWTWDFGDGSPLVVQTNGGAATHIFTQPGEYRPRLMIRNSAGCVDTSYSVLIEVGTLIAGDFTAAPLEVCLGDTVQFTNLVNDPRVDAWHFYSDNFRQWHCFQNQNPSWVYGYEAGPMDVSLAIEYNGCLNIITKEDYITLKGPIARLHYETTCENTLLFDFSDLSSGATQVEWTLSDSTTTDSLNFTHLFALPGTYQVVLKAENPGSGCPASTDTATVYATQLSAQFGLPYYICANVPYMLDGGASQDVNAVCYKGYTWYFENDRPIRTSNVSTEYVFSVPGEQKVWLEVEDINGCRDTIGQDIKVYTQQPKFSCSDTLICLPATVSFFDLSTADTTLNKWTWDFGDGFQGSGPNPVHTFTNPPLSGLNYYVVSLTVTDTLGCSASTTLDVYLYEPSSTLITNPQPNICEGRSITFLGTDYTAGGSNLSWSWNFGDGGMGSGQSLPHTYVQAGTYTVTMTYTELGSGCTGTRTRQVNVQSYPEANFTTNVDSLNIICYPQNIQLTNTSASNFPVGIFWNLGNGQTVTGPAAATVFPKGTFTVQMIAVTTFGCADTISRSFTVVGPEGTFAMDKNFICRGDEITFTLLDTVDVSSYSWSFGDGTTADNINPAVHAYNFLPPSGVTIARLVLRGEDDACSFTVSKPVSFSLVDANFTTVQNTVCPGQEHQFVNQSTADDEWLWSFGDGSSSNVENPTYEFDAEGVYQVTLVVTDQPLGCKDTLTQTVEVAGLPNFEAVGATVCAGDTATIGLLQPVLGATYTWSPANTVLNPQNQAVVQVAPTSTTVYEVSVVVDSTGCMDSDTALVFVPGQFAGAQNLDTIVNKGQPVTLPVDFINGYTYEWAPDDPGNPAVVTATDSSLQYVLTVTDPFGCYESLFEFFVRVFPEKVIVPNAFTPDGDSTNDLFRLIPDGEMGFVNVDYLRIYNRWGQKVFEATGTDASVRWDGKVQGSEAPVDVYIWQAKVTYQTGRSETLSGELTLLR